MMFKQILKVEDLNKKGENVNIKNADAYFICGPGQMIDSTIQFLIDSEISKEKIHCERFTNENNNIAEINNTNLTKIVPIVINVNPGFNRPISA